MLKTNWHKTELMYGYKKQTDVKNKLYSVTENVKNVKTKQSSMGIYLRKFRKSF